MTKQRVLFICTHNSARSQMAEAMLRTWAGDAFEVFSAGTEANRVRSQAIAVMDEIGIDISGQQSKTLDRYLNHPFDWVITVCDTARQNCPVFPGVEQTAHWGVDDPTEATGTDADRMDAFRRARDDLRNRIHLFMLTAQRADLRQQPSAMGRTDRHN
ncbi:MAG: arsenate reductase ArsC [Chloroflexota bacterium]|nr:arsenate reductase ArsC [Chloroflexota bacterium]